MNIKENTIRLPRFLLFAALAACGGGTGPDLADVANIEIDPRPIEVEVQSNLQLQAVVTDASGSEVSRSSIHWSVEDDSIAEISSSGVLTGKAVGTTRVAASAQGVDGLATVKVLRPGVVIVTISPSRTELREGESRNLSVVALDRLDQTVTGAIEWRSANTKVAQVSSNGRVTAVGPGSTKITATIGGVVGESTIEVSPRQVASVQVSPESPTLNIGNTQQLDVTLKASDGTILTGRTVTWSSSDPKVASVSSTGLVTARAEGTATIRATAEGKYDTASVRIRERRGGGDRDRDDDDDD